MTNIQLFARTPASTPSGNPRKPGEWAPLSLLMVGVFMIVLDFFIVNAALPSIQSGLHARGSDVEWAFSRNVVELVILLAGVGVLTRLLPGRRERSATRVS